jgi:hypothetical protein
MKTNIMDTPENLKCALEYTSAGGYYITVIYGFKLVN